MLLYTGQRALFSRANHVHPADFDIPSSRRPSLSSGCIGYRDTIVPDTLTLLSQGTSAFKMRGIYILVDDIIMSIIDIYYVLFVFPSLQCSFYLSFPSVLIACICPWLPRRQSFPPQRSSHGSHFIFDEFFDQSINGFV